MLYMVWGAEVIANGLLTGPYLSQQRFCSRAYFYGSLEGYILELDPLHKPVHPTFRP